MPNPISPVNAPSSRQAIPLGQVKDLCRGGVVLEFNKIGYSDDESGNLRHSVAIWYDPTATRGGNKGSVWLVYTEDFRSNIKMLFGMRARLKEYTLVTEYIADSGQITKIYDRHQQENQDQEFGQSRRTNDVNRYLDNLLRFSIENDVSDIHIERRRLDSRVRVRMLGDMKTHQAEVSTEFITRVANAIYNVEAEEEGKDSNFRSDKPQAATISRFIGNMEYKLRFQSLVAYPDGFDVVLRILKVGADGDREYTTLEKLGYSSDQVMLIEEIVSKPVGVLIVAGVTGSGKSTTLKSLVMWINATRNYSCKIYSIEDPPEYRIPGITQMPVRQLDDRENPATQVSPFLAPLKAAMRGDPDVIMIGEVRDQTTAEGVKNATQSGHQVLTTIHAPSGFGIFERLHSFGLDNSTLGSADFISGLIYQRLAPRLCPDCSIPFQTLVEMSTATPALVGLGRRLEDVMGQEAVRRVRVRGTDENCATCRGLGIVGRTVCAEVIKLDRTMLRYVRRNEMVEAAQRWRQRSDQKVLSDQMDGKTALEHALFKVAQGQISPLDAEALFGRVDTAAQEIKEIEEDEALRRAAGLGPTAQDASIRGRRSPAWSREDG